MKKLALLAIAGVALSLSQGAIAGKGSPYVGAMLGYSDTTVNARIINTEPGEPLHADTDLGSGGFNAGLLAGYGVHFDSGVWLAGEVNAMTYFYQIKGGDSSGAKSRIKVNDSYGVDFAPGYFITNDVKLFALLGYQWSQFKYSNNEIGYSTHKTQGGFDAGVGMDVSLNEHFALRASYKYMSFSKVTAGSDGAFITEKYEPSTQLFNLGIVYKFM